MKNLVQMMIGGIMLVIIW